jgi:hypothetical protein
MRIVAFLFLLVLASCSKEDELPYPYNNISIYRIHGDSVTVVYETIDYTEERGLVLTNSYDKRFMGAFETLERFEGKRGIGYDTMTIRMPKRTMYLRSYASNGDVTHISELFVSVQR